MWYVNYVITMDTADLLWRKEEKQHSRKRLRVIGATSLEDRHHSVRPVYK
jgi:hypothetical protein